MTKKLLRKSFFIVLVLGLFACKQRKDEAFHGYMESDFVMIAPSTSGILKTLSVKRGQTVEVGADLFSLDLTNLYAAGVAAKANLLCKLDPHAYAKELSKWMQTTPGNPAPGARAGRQVCA